MRTAFDEVMTIRGDDAPAVPTVEIRNTDPVVPTRFRVGETCAAVLAGIGVAASDLWTLRGGSEQKISVDVRAAAAALGSATHLQRQDANGNFVPLVSAEHEAMRAITQPWPTRDDRWFLPHFGLPNLRAIVLGVLECEPNPASVARAVARWNALDLEAAIEAAGACGAMVRSNEEWLAEPHGQVLAGKPIVEIIKVADSAPEPFAPAARPLDGVRVLDLTRILAGPIAARTLAEHGADVLMVTDRKLPQIPEHVLDTSHGKRSCFLDLKDPAEADTLRGLVRTTDVFSQGYRPGALERMGFGVDRLAELRPGIVCVSISCFGNDGPFSHRPGWEQVAQTVTGICQEGLPDRPALLPVAACDYTTGYLAAYGTLLALARRAREGGSYHIRVSLCQSGMWIHRQGKVPEDMPVAAHTSEELDRLRIRSPTAEGPLRHLGPILELSRTPPGWDRPTPTMGSSAPRW